MKIETAVGLVHDNLPNEELQMRNMADPIQDSHSISLDALSMP
jgi:hypothetical protein